MMKIIIYIFITIVFIITGSTNSYSNIDDIKSCVMQARDFAGEELNPLDVQYEGKFFSNNLARWGNALCEVNFGKVYNLTINGKDVVYQEFSGRESYDLNQEILSMTNEAVKELRRRIKSLEENLSKASSQLKVVDPNHSEIKLNTEQSIWNLLGNSYAGSPLDQVEQEAIYQHENIDYFNNNREQIIFSISTSFSEKNYPSVLSQSEKYLAANDDELNGLYAQAKMELDEILRVEKEAKEKVERENQTQEILAKLKTIPASKFKVNKDLYQQLVNLNPENSKYQEKLEHYSQKLNEQIVEVQKEQERLKKEQEMRIAKFGEPPTQSGWDGSYSAVKQYLRSVANDPDSIKIDGCTKVSYTERGWRVGCDYRGKNAYGATIRQSNWFTIRHGRVDSMR